MFSWGAVVVHHTTFFWIKKKKVRLLQWPHLCMLLTVHIGICDGNVHQVRGKQHNGLWLAGSAEWAALNNGAHWVQINKGYSFRWNWRNGEDETRAYLSKRLREMIFHNACTRSSKAFLEYSYFRCFTTIFFFFLFAVFPFLYLYQVNAFSREIGQSRGA